MNSVINLQEISNSLPLQTAMTDFNAEESLKPKLSVLPNSTLPTNFNHLGEAPLNQAPKIELANGNIATPQQFLHYWRTKENIEQIISQIQFSTKLPIFVYEDGGHCFLQVGIIGHENYPPLKQGEQINRNDKIVYGRKWFIEPHTPTSEVIQTAFLALQKVREHELREFFALTFEKNGKTYKSTPFNTHMDLPLMANNAELFALKTMGVSDIDLEELINNSLSEYSLCGSVLHLHRLVHITENVWHVSIKIDELHAPFKHFFPELHQVELHFSVSFDDCSNNPRSMGAKFLHLLFDSMQSKSYEYLCEHFQYLGFARFSQQIPPKAIAEFSVETRVLKQQRSEVFNKAFKAMAAHVDGGKAPKMANSEQLYQLQQRSLNACESLEGYLPKQM